MTLIREGVICSASCPQIYLFSLMCIHYILSLDWIEIIKAITDQFSTHILKQFGEESILTLSIRARSEMIIRASSTTSFGPERSNNLFILFGSKRPLLTSWTAKGRWHTILARKATGLPISFNSIWSRHRRIILGTPTWKHQGNCLGARML